MLVFTYLFIVAVIDFEHHLILRPLSIAGIVIGALTGFLMQGWKSTLIGGIAGFSILGIFYLFGKLFIRFRNRKQGMTEDGEEALGSGDITLAIVLGLMVGWPLIWFNILIGVLLAGVISLFIILWLVITKRYPKNAFMVYIPLGPGFIFVTMMIIYFPHYLSLILPK